MKLEDKIELYNGTKHFLRASVGFSLFFAYLYALASASFIGIDNWPNLIKASNLNLFYCYCIISQISFNCILYFFSKLSLTKYIGIYLIFNIGYIVSYIPRLLEFQLFFAFHLGLFGFILIFIIIPDLQGRREGSEFL